MEDFFKQFRVNLEYRPEPAFEERDWRDLEKQLEAQKTRAGFGWWWLVLPLLLLLVGLNGTFLYKLQQSSQKIATLEIRIDTIYKTKVIYQIDTIYKTRILKEQVIEYRTLDGNPFTYPSIPIPLISHETPANPLITKSLSIANAKEIVNNPSFLAAMDKIPSSKHHFLSIPSPDLPKMPEDLMLKKPGKTFRQQLYTMRPKGFQVGINGGGAFPFSSQTTPIPGYSIGLQGVVEFSPNLQLWTDVTYLNTRFETHRMDAICGLPAVEPPSDDFIFSKAEAPQPALQFSLGMQYLFSAANKLQPLIGAGVGAVSLLPYDIIYEFKNQSLGIEWNLDKTVYSHDILTNFWFARAGLHYKISEHLQGQLLTTYRGNWQGKNIPMPTMLGIQTGLYYQF